ncbi:MAG: Serine/threonine protein kinase [Cyanobacteria bacterium RYN_339]|nr:Serine/threonine protein kinase [Cyanobacteria bacterium RYN_339]
MTDAAIADRYRPLRLLGEGAMGQVLLALDETTGDEVALKVISRRRATGPGLGSTAAEKSTRQLRQEFRLMTRLRHPHCCAVYDYGLATADDPFFTMEVVPGQGLDELLPLSPARFEALFPQLLLALSYVHQQGLVHLDIKSANVRVTPDGSVKLMDYGLMEYAGHGSGVIRGTLPYISPEMARRAPVDQRSDLYSAGVLAYEMLTGRLPFERRTAVEVLRAHLAETPAPPSRFRPEVPLSLDRLVLRLLAKEPVERFQSAGEVLEALGFEAPPGIGGSLFGAPMVGRDAELEVLKGMLAGIQAMGPGGTVHLDGPAGIGKSRLIEEFRIHVQLAHVPFARGTAPEHQRSPYAAVVEILRALLPALRRHVPQGLEQAGPVLVRLLPELGALPAPAMESPKHEMLRLHAAVANLLAELAALQPLVVVLDDWQWADEPTIAFITHVRRNLGTAPIILLLAAQGATADAALPMPLTGLERPAVHRMVCNMLGSEQVEPTFSEAVGAMAAASPLYVERLLEHLVKSGALVRRAGRWNTDLDLRRASLPATLDALVLQKLAGLPEDVLAIARVAAAFERPATIDVLAAVSGQDDARLFDALATLQRAQVLVQDDHEAYGFVQHRDRDVLYAGLTAEARAALHGTIADVLTAQVAGRAPAELPADLVVALATHALHGDRPEAAVAYNLEAGRRAVSLFALADADAFLTAGLVVLDTLPAPAWRQERLAYTSELGEAKRQAGLAGEALGWLDQATALAEALGEAEALGTLLVRAATCHQMLADYDRALATAARAADQCQAVHDLAGAARAMRVVGRVHFFRGALEPARAAADRSLELARASGRPGILGLAYALSGFLIVAGEPARMADGVEQLRAAVALLAEVGDRVGLNDAYNLLGNAELMLGEPGPARTAFEASSMICRENGLREEACVALVSLASTAVALGAFQEARKQAEEVRELAAAIDARLPLGMAMAMEGLAASYLGDLAHVEGPTAGALALARGMGNRYLEATVLVPRIEALVQLGRAAEAVETCAALARLVAETGNAEPEGPGLAWHAIACVALGRAPEALGLAARARAIADRGGVKSLQVLVGLAEALALVAEERWSEARQAAATGLALAEVLGLLGRAAELRGVLGEIALATGDGAAPVHFEAMAALAARTANQTAQALAAFGLAAAAPYAANAEALARAAGEALRTLALALPAEAARQFTCQPAHARVLDGSYLAFSLRRQRRAGPPPGGFGLSLSLGRPLG